MNPVIPLVLDARGAGRPRRRAR